MAKKNDETLFNVPVETEDLDVSKEVSLRVPSTQGAPEANAGTAPVTPTTIHETMLNGPMPQLLAVDIAPGEIPRSNSVVQESIADPAVVIPPVQPATPEVKTEPVINPATQPPNTGKETQPATTPASTVQGQQGGKDTTEENLSPMYLHATALHQEGVLPNLDLKEFEGLKGADFTKKLIEASRTEVNDQTEAGIDAYKNQFNDPQKQVLNMLGEGVPFDDAANIVYDQQRYGSLTEDQIKASPEIQERVYREFLQVKGHKQDFIDQSVKQATDLELLEKNSIDASVELKQMTVDQETAAVETAKQTKADNKIKNDKAIENIQTDVAATTSIFKDVPFTKEDQAVVLSYMTVPTAEVNRGGKKVQISKMDEVRMKNPLEYAKRLAYFIHKGLFDENATIPELVASGETAAVNKLASVLEGGTTPAGGTPVITTDDQNAASGKPGETPEIKMPTSISSVRHDE